ncbi:MAG TPA: hypothetical protein VJV79_23730 [Polyangiaceae bacterium]|nr:hypothetical protein [Polyangiaceae bacterium]
MSPSKSWAILAALPPLTAATLGVLLGVREHWFTRCGYRVPPWLGTVTVAWFVLMLLTLAAMLTIATEAARRPQHGPLQRFAWVLVLFVASPLTAPLYWALYLRQRD